MTSRIDVVEGKVFRFEGLHVYQEAETFFQWAQTLMRRWPSSYRYSLTDQLQRAVLSILLNIAEGSSRTRRDFQHFLTIARGSCFECVAIMRVAKL
jgi:four helix bundle protein